MALLALQRLVRLSPGAARLAWQALPRRAQRALSRWVHPIAAGSRRGTRMLEVPKPERAARFDVVLFEGAEQRGIERFGEAGHRIFEIGSRSVEDLARAERVFDAVSLIRHDDRDSERAASRLGWRVARAVEEIERSFPGVAIVIPTHAARELCRNAIHAVLRSTGWARYRVVVVDDASCDGTAEMLAELAACEPRISVVRQDVQRGFAAACNRGVALSQDEFVVLLNDDTVVAPGWLSRLIAHLERDPKLALIGPVTNQSANAAKIEVGYDSLAEMETFATERAVLHAAMRQDVDTVTLFCAAMRKKQLDELGGLDERYEIGMFEDDDLCMALRTRGHRVAIARDGFVHHVGHATLGQLDDADYLGIWEANRRRFEDKWRVVWRPQNA